ncbi:MAG: hypothetical protein ACJAVN_001117 [Roseivirga sp.]|jgi:hypothetical protein
MQPRIEMLSDIAAALDVDIRELLVGGRDNRGYSQYSF